MSASATQGGHKIKTTNDTTCYETTKAIAHQQFNDVWYMMKTQKLADEF